MRGERAAPASGMMGRYVRESDGSRRSSAGRCGTRLVWENDRVRIWELVLAPGERSAVHAHTLDYLLIPLAGDRIAVEVEPDTAGEYRESGDFPVPVGKASSSHAAASRPR